MQACVTRAQARAARGSQGAFCRHGSSHLREAVYADKQAWRGDGTARRGGSLDRGSPWPAARPPHGRRAGPGVWLILARGAAGLVTPAVLREGSRWAWIVTLVGVPRTLRGVGCRCVCWGVPPSWTLVTADTTPAAAAPVERALGCGVGGPCVPPPRSPALPRGGLCPCRVTHTSGPWRIGCCPCQEGRAEGTRGQERGPSPRRQHGRWSPGERGRRALSLCPVRSLGLHCARAAGGRRAGSNHAVLRSGHQPLHRRAAPHRVVRQDLAGEAALLDPHAGRRARAAAVR